MKKKQEMHAGSPLNVYAMILKRNVVRPLSSLRNHTLPGHYEHVIFSGLFSTAYERTMRAGELQDGITLVK
jgi:hypothetical protein